MSEAFDAADVLQFDHVDPMSHDTLRLGEVSRDSSTLLRTGGLGLALEADFGPSHRDLPASHAARCVACHGVRSHAVPVALVAECSMPVV
jgi:hypothetical protein